MYTVGYATTNKCYKEQFLSIKSGCYNELRCYNERGGILLAKVARACMTCRAFPLWLERQSLSLLSFAGSVISLVQLFVPLAVKILF